MKKGRHLKSEESLEMEIDLSKRVKVRREMVNELYDEWVSDEDDFDYKE